MSLLIKGMKMPKNCLMCQFHGMGGYKNELIVCSLTGRSEGQLSNVLGCPLVEVPTPHGRLIDADIVCYQLEKQATIDGQPRAIRRARKIVADAPTIIEAEEGEEA